MSLKQLRQHRSLWSPRTWLLYFLNKRLPTATLGTLTDVQVDRGEQSMQLVLADAAGPTLLRIRGYRLDGRDLRWDELSADGPRAQDFRARIGRTRRLALTPKQRLLAEYCLTLFR